MERTTEVFARNLRQKLEEKGRTQAMLVRYLGTTSATVSRWATGESLPRPAMLERISVYLGCTVDELMRDPEYIPTLLPEDVIAEEIRENPKLLKLFLAALRAEEDKLDTCIEILTK